MERALPTMALKREHGKRWCSFLARLDIRAASLKRVNTGVIGQQSFARAIAWPSGISVPGLGILKSSDVQGADEWRRAPTLVSSNTVN